MLITAVTLNTWKCDSDYVARLPLMASALADTRPDLVLLQGVFATVDGRHDTAMFLARELNC
ncbi:MAG: hypothetical protein VW405_05730 [Rhodospirillaceae bacterium]